MRVLNRKQAREFFEDIITDEFGPFSLELKDDVMKRAVMINGHIVCDARKQAPHAVLFYDAEIDSWSRINLTPEVYWEIREEGIVQRYVTSIEYAMYRCGYDLTKN